MTEEVDIRIRRWEWLIRLIRFHGYTIGAEIGVYRGRTTYELMKHCPDLKLYAVDKWEYIPANLPLSKEIGLAGQNMGRALRHFMKNVYKYPNRLEVLRGDSVEIADKIPDNHLDFVFIDADHRYDAVLEDIKAWTPKVKEDGVVCGHDYNHPRYPGVTKAVDECFGDNVINANQDYVWSAKKEDFLK